MEILSARERFFNKPEIREFLGYISRYRSELEKTLMKKQKKLFDRMIDNQNEFDSLAKERIFEYGFKLVLR